MTEFASYRSGETEAGELLSPPLEIERKFLLSDDVEYILEDTENEHLDQGYLRSRGDTEARVRRAGDDYTFTVKHGSGSERLEQELPITSDEFEALWPLTTGRQIQKTRYKVPIQDELIAEIDVYAGRHQGLSVVEVEFSDTAAKNAFEVPSWFGQEVSDEPQYKNKNLATQNEEWSAIEKEAALNGITTYISVLSRALDRPVVVAVAGGTASGKTTAVANRFVKEFGDRAAAISLDDYYRGLTYMNEQKSAGHELNWDQPEAVDLLRAARDVAGLRSGREVVKPVYSFVMSEQSGEETLSLADKTVLVVEGLFALTDDIAEAADITLFVNTTPHGRVIRRLMRDVVRTSWSPEEIITYFPTVEDMHQQYIEPTAANADLVIDNDYDPKVEASRAGIKEMQLKYRLPPDSDITEESLRQLGAEILGPETTQIDTYHDSLPLGLPGHGETVRIREQNGKLLLSYKGPQDTGADIRIRDKMEVPITEEGRKAIEKLYPRLVSRVIKQRKTFYIQGGVLTLDDVRIERDGAFERLGKFIEIRTNFQEQTDGAQIFRIAEHIGLMPEMATTQPYSEMRLTASA